MEGVALVGLVKAFRRVSSAYSTQKDELLDETYTDESSLSTASAPAF